MSTIEGMIRQSGNNPYKIMKTHSDLVEELCLIRKSWKHEDFVEAYGDEWFPVPADLSDCHEMMETHIYNSYDTDYVKEVIENEKHYL